MKKDLKNVATTFSLVVSMTLGSVWLYTKDTSTEQAALKQQTEYEQKEILAQQSMHLLLLTKSNEADDSSLVTKPDTETELVKITDTTSLPIQNQVVPTTQSALILESQIQAAAQAAAKQEAEAKAKREADALSKQIADAKAAAEKKEEAAAAAKKNSRKSKAS